MSAEQQQWYLSKVDWWLVPILCVAAVAASVASVLEGSMPGLLVGAAMAVFVAGLYFGVVFPMRYGLDDTHLIVRSGACRRRIPLAEISEVSPTRSPLSSPALSLDPRAFQPGFVGDLKFAFGRQSHRPANVVAPNHTLQQTSAALSVFESS